MRNARKLEDLIKLQEKELCDFLFTKLVLLIQRL